MQRNLGGLCSQCLKDLIYKNLLFWCERQDKIPYFVNVIRALLGGSVIWPVVSWGSLYSLSNRHWINPLEPVPTSNQATFAFFCLFFFLSRPFLFVFLRDGGARSFVLLSYFSRTLTSVLWVYVFQCDVCQQDKLSLIFTYEMGWPITRQLSHGEWGGGGELGVCFQLTVN